MMKGLRKAAGILALVGAMLAFAVGVPARAEPYPSRTITVIVPFAPGSGIDVVARQLVESLRQQLSATILVENRPGASGAVGAAAVAKAPKDGYTLLLSASPPFSTAPFALDAALYDPLASFVPVSQFAVAPVVLVTSTKAPVSTFAEFIAFAKAHPEKSTYVSAGTGSVGDLYGALISQAFGAPMQEIPYKGHEQGLLDVTSGTILTSFTATSGAIPHIEAGRLRALAVGARERIAQLPDVPTFAEVLERPGFQAVVWYGLLAPAGVPRDIVDRLSDEVAKAVATPRVTDLLKRLGFIVDLKNSAEFAKALATDVDFSRKMIKAKP